MKDNVLIRVKERKNKDALCREELLQRIAELLNNFSEAELAALLELWSVAAVVNDWCPTAKTEHSASRET